MSSAFGFGTGMSRPGTAGAGIIPATTLQGEKAELARLAHLTRAQQQLLLSCRKSRKEAIAELNAINEAHGELEAISGQKSLNGPLFPLPPFALFSPASRSCSSFLAVPLSCAWSLSNLLQCTSTT